MRLPTIKTLTLFICFIGIVEAAIAQKAKKIEIVGDTLPHRDIFVVGEIHTNNERPDFNTAIADFVREQYGITNYVYEYGPSLAYLLNMYLYDRDTSCFPYCAPAFRQKLDRYRELNKTQPPGRQIRIYGVDFDRVEFLAATKLILRKNPAARNTALYSYISGLPDALAMRSDHVPGQRGARNAAYRTARSTFASEKETLKQAVTIDYDALEAIYENAATERHFAKRDKAMYQNIGKRLADKKYILTVGSMHASYHNGQTRRSVAWRLWKNGTRFSSIMQVCKATYGRAQWYYNTSDTGAHLFPPSGPGCIIKNDSIMNLAFSKYYRPGYFSLINGAEFKPLIKKGKCDKPTYYTFFDYPVRE